MHLIIYMYMYYNTYFLISLRPILGILTTCILLYVCVNLFMKLKFSKGVEGEGGGLYLCFTV